jgi:hypothetical protein
MRQQRLRVASRPRRPTRLAGNTAGRVGEGEGLVDRSTEALFGDAQITFYIISGFTPPERFCERENRGKILNNTYCTLCRRPEAEIIRVQSRQQQPPKRDGEQRRGDAVAHGSPRRAGGDRLFHVPYRVSERQVSTRRRSRIERHRRDAWLHGGQGTTHVSRALRVDWSSRAATVSWVW